VEPLPPLPLNGYALRISSSASKSKISSTANTPRRSSLNREPLAGI